MDHAHHNWAWSNVCCSFKPRGRPRWKGSVSWGSLVATYRLARVLLGQSQEFGVARHAAVDPLVVDDLGAERGMQRYAAVCSGM